MASNMKLTNCVCVFQQKKPVGKSAWLHSFGLVAGSMLGTAIASCLQEAFNQQPNWSLL